jgi:hypothetical protein
MFSFSRTSRLSQAKKNILKQFEDDFKGDSRNLPKLFKTCLEHPEQFKDKIFTYFNTVTQQFDDYNEPLYNGANLMTLLFCATFHLGKLYVAKNYGTIQDAQLHYNAALASLLTSPDEEKMKILYLFNMKQETSGFLNCYQYGLLMQHITTSTWETSDDISDSIMRRYFKIIQNQTRQNLAYIDEDDDDYDEKYAELIEFTKFCPTFDIKKDIFDIVLKSKKKFSDIYDSDIKKGISIEVSDLYYNNNIYYNIIHDLDSFEPLDRVFDDDSDYEDENGDDDGALTEFGTLLKKDLKKYISPYVNIDNIKMLLLLNQTLFNVLFDYQYSILMTDINLPDVIKHNKLFDEVQALIWQLLENSNNLAEDGIFILQVFGYQQKGYFVNFLFKDETIFHPIMRNKHFEKNSNFIRTMINYILTGKEFKKLEDIANNDYYASKLKLLIHHMDESNNNVLLLLLAKLYPDVGVDVSNKIVSLKESIAFGNKLPSVLKYSVDTQSSVPSVSTDVLEGLRKIFKTTIKNLIKYYQKIYSNDKQNNPVVKAFLSKLTAYKVVLADAGIDISNLYKIQHVLDSAQSINKQSVFNKYTSIKSPLDDNKNIFINFINKDLMKKMENIYIRSVQSDNESENNFDRIIKIREWLMNKYNKYSDNIIILEVEAGKELETLYNYWLSNKNSLLKDFNIEYEDEAGRDAGGLTKQFFTAIQEQIRDKYFMVIEGTDKYVLKYEKNKFEMSVDEAMFLGRVIAAFILNEMTLEYNLSYFYLAHMMFEKKHLNNEEKFMYYLLDIDPATKNNHIEGCSNEFLAEDLCNLPDLVTDNIERRYHFNDPVFNAFIDGFYIKKKYFYSKFANIDDKIRIYDMAKLITTTKLSPSYLKKAIFDKLKLFADENDSKRICGYLTDIMLSSANEYKTLYQQYDTSILKGDASMTKIYVSMKSDQEYKKNVLMFWTGSKGICTNPPYQLTIITHSEWPRSHTCFNQLELPQTLASKQELFNKFMNMFVFNQHKAFTDA